MLNNNLNIIQLIQSGIKQHLNGIQVVKILFNLSMADFKKDIIVFKA